MNSFDADTAFPPSLSGMPLLTMLTVMCFWAGALLCLQWAYSIVDDMREFPAPLRHPLTAARAVKLLLLAAGFMSAIPRLILLMTWQKLSADWREAFSLSSWVIYIPWAMIFALAWWLDRATRPLYGEAIKRFPVAELAPSTATEKIRGIIILILIFVVAFATTFVRPHPDVARPPAFIERH